MKTFFENGSNRNHDRRMCDAAVVQLVSARRNCTEGRERPSADRSTADASQRRRVTRRQPRRFASGQRMLETAVATTTPRIYDDYDCYGDPYAGRGYPPGYYYNSYPGGYCVSREYSTGLYTRPTLFPRYYGGWCS